MAVVIEVEGTEITADVLLAEATFAMQTGRSPGEFSIGVRDDDKTYDFVAGNQITLDVDGVRCFDGYIMLAEQTFPFYVDDVTNLGTVSRFWKLSGVDLNILFEKRITYNVADPAEDTVEYPEGTNDTTYLNDLVDDYLNLGGDNLTFNFNHVGSPNPDLDGSLMPGQSWGYNMAQIARLPGAIWGIRPNREVYYEDDDTETAPFRLSDQPNNSTSFGYSNLEWMRDGTKLVNDALVWGAGTGSANRVLARTTDDDSIDTHNKWQTGQFRGDVFRQTTANAIANSIVYGSPQNLHGGKDDAEFITCRIRKPGLQAGEKVHITSNLFGVSGVYPIRRMMITFVNPEEALFDLQLTWEVDAPLNYSEFWWPKYRGLDPPPPPPPPPPRPDCGITDSFDGRVTTLGWGVADCGWIWGGNSGAGPLQNTYLPGEDYASLGVPPTTASGLLGTSMGIAPINTYIPNSDTFEVYFEFMGIDFSNPVGDPARDPDYRQALILELNQSSTDANLTQLFLVFQQEDGGAFQQHLGLWRYNHDASFDPFFSDFEFNEFPYGFATGTIYKVRLLATREHSYARVWAGDTEPEYWSIASNVFFESGTLPVRPLPPATGDELEDEPQVFRFTFQSFQSLSSPFSSNSIDRKIRIDTLKIWLDGVLVNRCYACGEVDVVLSDDFDRTLGAGWGTNGEIVWEDWGDDTGESSVNGAEGVLVNIGAFGSVNNYGTVGQRTTTTGPWVGTEWSATVRFRFDHVPTGEPAEDPPQDQDRRGTRINFGVASSGSPDDWTASVRILPDPNHVFNPSFVSGANQILLHLPGHTQSADWPDDWGVGSYFAEWLHQPSGTDELRVWPVADARPSVATVTCDSSDTGTALAGKRWALIHRSTTDQSNQAYSANTEVAFDSFEISGRSIVCGHTNTPALAPGSYGCENADRLSDYVYELSYTFMPGTLTVYRDGTQQRFQYDYIETASNQITFRTGVGVDESIYVCYFASGNAPVSPLIYAWNP